MYCRLLGLLRLVNGVWILIMETGKVPPTSRHVQGSCSCFAEKEIIKTKRTKTNLENNLEVPQ